MKFNKLTIHSNNFILFNWCEWSCVLNGWLYNEGDSVHEFVGQKWLGYIVWIQCNLIESENARANKRKHSNKFVTGTWNMNQQDGFWNKVKSQTKNKAFVKQTINRFFAFPSPISHVESTKQVKILFWVFRYLQECAPRIRFIKKPNHIQ